MSCLLKKYEYEIEKKINTWLEDIEFKKKLSFSSCMGTERT